MALRKWRISFLALTLLASLSLFVAACGDDDDDDDGGDSGTDLTAASVDCKGLGLTAPARIKSAGKLVVASDLSYAPIDFTKEGTTDAIGLDADIANCIASAWGVKAEIQNTGFDAIIPALTSKKADVIMSAMSVNEERKKTIDFVEYFNAGSGIMVKKGNPDKIGALKDLCGKKVAIQLGTVQVDEAEEQNKSCDKKIEVQTFEQNTDAITAVTSGRVSAALMDFPVAAYNAKILGAEVVGAQYNEGPYGIGVRKDDGEVKTALEAAIKAMREKGQYDKILEYWDLKAGALK